jgi:hypothetical protein
MLYNKHRKGATDRRLLPYLQIIKMTVTLEELAVVFIFALLEHMV